MANHTSRTQAIKPKAHSKRAYRPQQWWFDHVRAWKTSQLNKAEYCQQHDLKRSSFYARASEYEKQQASFSENHTSSIDHKPFIQAVALSPSSDSVASSLTMNNITLTFQDGLPAQALLDWVSSIRAVSC